MKDEQKTKPLISEMEDPRSNLMAIRKILISYAKITINGESILFFFSFIMYFCYLISFPSEDYENT